MFFRIALVFIITVGLAAPITAQSKKSAPTRPNYKGYIVIDAASGETLDQENPDVVTPPASVTKLMTFLIVHDALAAGRVTLDTPVRVSVAASKMGGTQVHLDPRETYSVREMLYALMVQSANDCAYALAEAVAGSREAFVEQMNARAKQLGMNRTTFRSPHGLPPPKRDDLANTDLTTPRDLSLLSRELLLTTDVLAYSSVRKMTFGEGQRAELMVMENHNKLLGKVAGVDGLKTGYTKGAGYCLSATAQRDGRRIIVVIMGALAAGGQADYGRSRDLKTIELIETNFPKIPANSRFVGSRAGAPATSLVTPASDSLITPEPTPVEPKETAPTAPPSVEANDAGAPAIQFKIPATKPKRPGSGSTVKSQ